MTDTTPLFVEPAAAPVVQADVSATPEPATTQPAAVADTAYVFVRMPDGSLRAVPAADVVNATDNGPATAISEAKAHVAAEIPEPHFYVWLADGTNRRVKESDLPPAAGTNAPFGLWVESGKTFVIAGVYPVEN